MFKVEVMYKLKSIVLVGFIFLSYSVLAQTGESLSGETLEIKGVISDASNGEKLARCNIYIKGKDVGTISNNSGEFRLTLPTEYENELIVISSIGYQNYEATVGAVKNGSLNIKLNSVALVLDEIIIQDVNEIIVAALNRRQYNYPHEDNFMTSFYREVVKKNRSYVEVSQGVMNISKRAYNNNAKDQIGIVLGGKSRNYNKGDTLGFKVMGGPNIMLLLDIVKNPGIILSFEMMPFYQYNLHGVEMIDGRRSYVIHFEPNDVYDTPLFSGIIYIDQQSMAIVGMNFGYDEFNLRRVADDMVKKQPSWVSVKPTKSFYEVKYRSTEDKWFLDYVRAEMEVKCKWKRRLFNSTFNSVSEMVVTNKNVDGELDLTKRNATKLDDIFSDKVVGFTTDEYWENYSIIQPEDDLKRALAKIEKKTRN